MWVRIRGGRNHRHGEHDVPFFRFDERAKLWIIVRLPRVRALARMTMQAGIPGKGFLSSGVAGHRCQKWGDNVQADFYWSGTEFASNTNNAWNVNFNDGNQNANNKDNNNFAWGVRSGE